MNFITANPAKLTEDDYKDAAEQLGCEVAAIKAIATVESGPMGGFLPDGRPVILFESHAFHTQTGGKYDRSHPGISTPSWVRNYGATGAHQYDRLMEAMALDETAALKSASWGRFQIMGLNYKNAGYDSVQEFVADQVNSECYQLDAFVTFLQNTGIDSALAKKDWYDVARSYNGPGQVDFYAGKLQEAYARFS